MRLTGLSFERWLEHVFGHEVRFQRSPWFFDPDSDWWDPTPDEAVCYLTRLFDDPEPALRWFTDSQIAQGMTYLVDTSASGDNGWLYATSVPIEHRLRCVTAIGTLFAKLFAPRCTPHLSHRGEADAGTLNCVCYMWWDGFPCLALPDDPHRAALHQAALRTMERTLALDSPACQESALHGLGHWQRDHPGEVAATVDAFLAASPDLDPRLSAYARAARCGCVL
ncbi:MAG TPA: hypothetical protein VFY87_20010 [Geminicoccaceae bacterium]|jgi:hypothetical protein|nr:hypothetical protein [Geminicoccaceae bacterium]